MSCQKCNNLLYGGCHRKCSCIFLSEGCPGLVWVLCWAMLPTEGGLGFASQQGWGRTLLALALRPSLPHLARPQDVPGAAAGGDLPRSLVQQVQTLGCPFVSWPSRSAASPQSLLRKRGQANHTCGITGSLGWKGP